jgi:hypothetical protein
MVGKKCSSPRARGSVHRNSGHRLPRMLTGCNCGLAPLLNKLWEDVPGLLP